jgi:cysteine synthase
MTKFNNTRNNSNTSHKKINLFATTAIFTLNWNCANPGASIKDRIALMIEDAEEKRITQKSRWNH